MSVQPTAGPAGSTTSGSRRRHLVQAALVTAAAAAALSAGAQVASAAGPYNLPSRTVAVFPTWSWGGTTTVCVQNPAGSWGNGKVRVTPTSNPTVYDDIYANPGQTSCIRRSWWGAPIVANNLSPSGVTLKVWTY